MLATAAQSTAPAPDKDTWADARRSFANETYGYLREPGENAVPIRRLMEAYGSGDPTPRQLRRLMQYDPNADGTVTQDEFYAGITDFVFFQVERHMGLDVDEDGRLTLEEHALQVPDDRGRRDEDGFVPRQRAYFADNDLNGDGAITRDELIENFSRIYIRLYGGWVMGYRARAADADGDGEISLAEFARLHGADAAYDALRKKHAAWSGSDGRLTVDALHDRFGRLSMAEQAELRPTVDAIWFEAGGQGPPKQETGQ